MKPVFKISANGTVLSDELNAQVLSLRITDESGTDSDSVAIEWDDGHERLIWPSHGAQLVIWLGKDESSLRNMGTFTVDELEHSGPPDKLIARGKAANMLTPLKASKSRSWHNILLGDMVDTIASQQGLKARVSQKLKDILIVHEDQTEESDLHFLTRLAKQLGAISKPVSGYWLFVFKGEAKSASGLRLPTINLEKSQIVDHRLTQAERGKYQAVKAHFHDVDVGEKESVQTGEGEPVFVLRHTYDSPEHALQAATAKLKSLNRGTATLSLTVLGNPQVMAEGKVNVKGLREPIAGHWVVTRVEHQLDSSGFTTQIETEVPNALFS